MPGHNAFEMINNDGVKTTGGKMLQVVQIGTNTPNSTYVDVQGYSRGAFMINTTGTTISNTIYINTGTTTTATWTALSIS
jgi:hypothetical protein